MTILKRNYQVLSLMLAGLVFLITFYGSVMLSPNDYFLNGDGDGIKNYFTYASYLKNNGSYLNFEGMNYPYGEHAFYTDNHPIIAITFKFLSAYIPSLETYAVGILNSFILVSFLITLLVCYYLLLAFKVERWVAVVFSLGITFLAPQFIRIIGGHLALSYCFAIPLSWLLYLKAMGSGRRVWIGLLFLNHLFWLLIHAYLGIICVSFGLLLYTTQVLFTKERAAFLMTKGVVLIQILAPVAIFFFFLKGTDFHSDRTDNPSGFFLYNAELYDFLLPPMGATKEFMEWLSNSKVNVKWEAWNYIGIVNIFMLLFTVLWLARRYFKGKIPRLKQDWQGHQPLAVAIIASMILLLFATGFPFRQFPQLLEFVPLVKQFRATGRFTWPLYFVSFVFSAKVFSHWYGQLVNSGRHRIGIALLALVCILNTGESLAYHRLISGSITESPNLFREDLLPQVYGEILERIDPEEYQAIIVLPFYYYGSESFKRPIDQQALRSSIVFSYHTGIPLFNASLTRTSIVESKNIVQLVSPSFYRKKIKGDLPDAKAALVLKTGDDLTTNEWSIIDRAEEIYAGSTFEIYHLPLEDLFQSNASEIHRDFEDRKSRLQEKDGFYVTDTSAYFFFENFDHLKSELSLEGGGAYHARKRGINRLLGFPSDTFEDSLDYRLSVWMHNGERDALNLWFRLMVIEKDLHSGRSYATIFFPEIAETIDGDWSLVEGTFRLRNTANLVSIETRGKLDSKAALHADNLLIHQVGVELFRVGPTGILFYNNHRIKRDE